MKSFLMLISLFALSACLSTGGDLNTSPTLDMIDEAAEDLEHTSTEPITDPELGEDPVVDWTAENGLPITTVVIKESEDNIKSKPIWITKHIKLTEIKRRPENKIYTAEVDGTINPSYSHLSNPHIELSYDTGLNSMKAEISYEQDGNRVVLERYGGVRISADGSFLYTDGLNGFDGTIFGDNKVVVGNVSTPRVYGTFVASTS